MCTRKIGLFCLSGILALAFAAGCKKSAAPPEAPRAARPAAPAPEEPADGAPLVPETIRPGLRLTFYLMTGSLSGSVNGWVPDEEGQWRDAQGRLYSSERKGYSSHGLVQATVVGGDGGTIALAEPFYLFNGNDLTPVFNSSMDSLVTADTGGDFWMHPRRQARVLRESPWSGAPVPGRILSRTVAWTDEAGRRYQATYIAIIGDASRTTYVYDQASGYLLYLSRQTRDAPTIRDQSLSLPDSVSYATFLRFRGARQLDLPWLGRPIPESLRGAQAISYRGQFGLQGPGIAPTPLALSVDFRVTRVGSDWMWLHARTQTQGSMMPNETNSVNGPGSLPPLAIPPAVLAGFTVGQLIDRDPLTGFAVRVSNSDGQYVSLQSDGPRQSTTYVYDRIQGLLVRRVSQERMAATPRNVSVHDIKLTGIQ